MLAGVVMTLMTWMERSTESVPAKIVAALGAGFLLGAGPLNHAIVGSLEMFAALQVGAPFGYLDWLGVLGWAALGNLVGGLGLVTLLRLVQVGPELIEDEREDADEPEEDGGEGGAPEPAPGAILRPPSPRPSSPAATPATSTSRQRP
jgi:hypothetical protein